MTKALDALHFVFLVAPAEHPAEFIIVGYAIEIAGFCIWKALEEWGRE